MRNGFSPDLEEQHIEETDWIFGTSSPPCIALIPEEERLKYLPIGEVQRGRDDFMDCATRGPINIAEAKFTFLYRLNLLTAEEKEWFDRWGYVVWRGGLPWIEFSDRYIAILSGTTKFGNSMKAPIDAIHSYGLIPKSMLPASPDMTLAEYLDRTKVTRAMEELGKHFQSRFTIYYDKVIDFDTTGDMEVNAGHAWPSPKNGIYPRNDGPFNHVWANIMKPRYTVYDNYIDSVDGDFIKRLAKDYRLVDHGYRLFIKRNEVKVSRSYLDQLISALFRGDLSEVWRLIAQKP